MFGVKQPAVAKHLNNIFRSGELEERSVHSILEYTASDGKIYNTKFYNLDAILSVGYRVNSVRATQFRIWANKILKDYLLNGYAVSKRFENLERRVSDNEIQLESLVQMALPPKQAILFDGQIFDAYLLLTKIIKSATTSIVLIDNYIDESTLLLLSKRKTGVKCTIFTQKLTSQTKLDIEKHNAQYKPINVKIYEKSHDRFIIIDNEDLYHIGASIKDAGKKLFAFSKLQIDPKLVLENIE